MLKFKEVIKDEKQLSAEEIAEVAWKNEIKKSTEISEVLDRMWLYNQTYRIGVADSKAKETSPMWYLMDEVGCAMSHSEMPNFACSPFFFLNKGIAFSLIWPLRDINEGERITRNFTPTVLANETECNYKARVLLLKRDSDFLPGVISEDEQPSKADVSDEAAFKMRHLKINASISVNKKIFCDFVDAENLMKLASSLGCSVSDEISNADIVLSSKMPMLNDIQLNTQINHFNKEELIFKRDELAKLIRKNIGQPLWFPKTYALRSDLPQLAADASKKGMSSYWIVRVADSSQAECKPIVTSDLCRIGRLSEAGIMVASECKYW